MRSAFATFALLILIISVPYNPSNFLVQNSAMSAATNGAYLQYAEWIAGTVHEKMWDPLYGGYFEIMNRSWDEILHPHKEFIYTYWQKAFCYLYDRTGNATYLDWAREITDVEIAYAWDSVNGGWYDEYNRTWGQDNLPQLRAYIKNAAVQGSMINMLLEVYSRTGNMTYYEYAVKTVDFLISNFHDPLYGGFYRTYNQSSGQPQDTGKGIEDSYGQVSYGLLKLYELTHNTTYLNLSEEAMDFTINHLWDSTYGGWLTEVDRTGSFIINDRKYPNEETWPIFGGFAYYYKITGNLTALDYVHKTMDYIDSKLWDPVYGGWFRSLWRNNTIRDDAKTAWDLAGEPWMIWEVYKMTGNTTYQEMARKGLDWVISTVMYDTVYGGVVTEVDRTGTTITDSVKDVEVESDAIASFSYVTDRNDTPIYLTGNLLQAKYLAEKVQQYMWDERYGGYYWTMKRTWDLKISDKTSTMLIIMGLLNLYERSGNTTYLVWAENAVNFILSNAWDEVNGGVYEDYNRSWCPNTTIKTLQRQAELLRVLIDLYRHTNHQRYYEYANRTAEFILAHYHDDEYGGQYKTYDQNTGLPVTTNKDPEVSLGSFGWAMMYWYTLTNNQTALEYTKEANDFIWTYLHDEIYGGLVTEVDRTGSIIVNDKKYPNQIIWGTLGMLEYYRATWNMTVKGWIEELFNYVRNFMWDPSYGGWFRSLWRNNTVRYSTKDGWSQTEQPWFWWFAYSILGDNYYADVARLSMNWTRTYIHDPTYSGFFLELYQNGTLYDDSKVDCVEGAGISALALVQENVSLQVTLNSPSQGSVETTNSITFQYSAVSYGDEIQNASLWLNLTGSWQTAQTNTTTVQNNTQNSISFNFKTHGSATYIWNIQIFNSTASAFATSNRTLYVDLEPWYDTAGHNATDAGGPCLFYSQWLDGDGLSHCVFGTNNTGIWANETYTLEANPDWCNVTKTLNSTVGVRVEYQFWANDTDNRWSTTGLLYIVTSGVEDEPPVITVLSPQNKTYTTTSVPLNFAVNEPTSWISYSLDNQANITITENTTLTLLEGSHNIVVYANDTAGNTGSSGMVYFTVDVTPPSITEVSQIPPKESVQSEDEVKVNAIVTDYISGVKQAILNYTNGNGTWITIKMTNLEGNLWNATIPAFPYCTYVNYTIVVEDNVGNVITTEEIFGYQYQYHVIPEFPSLVILPLFMIAPLLAVVIYRRHSIQLHNSDG